MKMDDKNQIEKDEKNYDPFVCGIIILYKVYRRDKLTSWNGTLLCTLQTWKSPHFNFIYENP